MTILPGLATLIGGAACGSSSSAQPNASSSGAAQQTPNAVESNPGGDIPDSTVYVPFQGPSGRYVISIPQGWARSTSSAQVSFTDKLNSVTLTEHAQPATPTVAQATATTVPQLQRSAQGFQLIRVEGVQRSAGSVLEIHYRATSGPDPVTGKTVADDVQRFEYFRNGTEVDVTLAGPIGADNVDPWQTITNSFRWL